MFGDESNTADKSNGLHTMINSNDNDSSRNSENEIHQPAYVSKDSNVSGKGGRTKSLAVTAD
jgi:hypothetical protein